jgi:glycosyltransferase involved in cell wall biosynthesis
MSAGQVVTSPKISVVIPTYNKAALLRETLDGVFRQSVKDFEVIVVDDGSADDTAEVVRTYGRVRYEHQPNQGPAAARNKGVKLARGELIAFCDHDDVWNERHLENMLRCLNAHPTAAMCFGDAEYFGKDVPEGVRHINPRVLRSMINQRVSLRRLWQCWVASMSVIMVRKSVFESLGGLHPGIWGLDDLHFYLRLGVGHEVRYADYVSCKKRLAAGNLLSEAGLDGLIACLEDLKKNHPNVVRAVGPLKLRARLARRYRKLAEGYLRKQQPDLARSMFLKAYRENFFNLYDLWSYLFRARPQKTAFAL